MRAVGKVVRKFIFAHLYLPHVNSDTSAAFATGHFSTPQSAQAWASKTMQRENVKLALYEQSLKSVQTKGFIRGHRAIMDLLAMPTHKDHFKAVEFVMAHSGMQVQNVTRHIIEDTRETKDIVRMAIDYARSLGDERLAYKLLGNSVPKDVIDAEFVVVSSDDGTAGLEDLL